MKIKNQFSFFFFTNLHDFQKSETTKIPKNSKVLNDCGNPVISFI